MKLIGHEVAGEALGRPRCELGVEPTHVDPLDADLSHELRAPLERGQKRGRAGAYHGTRMWIEREHARRQCSGPGLLYGLAQNGLMASMDPVEVSDDQRARQCAHVRRGRGAIDVDQPGGDHFAR